MKIRAYPATPGTFDEEIVECESWNRIDAFTIGVWFYPDEDSITYQTWQSQDCPMEVDECVRMGECLSDGGVVADISNDELGTLWANAQVTSIKNDGRVALANQFLDRVLTDETLTACN